MWALTYSGAATMTKTDFALVLTLFWPIPPYILLLHTSSNFFISGQPLGNWVLRGQNQRKMLLPAETAASGCSDSAAGRQTGSNLSQEVRDSTRSSSQRSASLRKSVSLTSTPEADSTLRVAAEPRDTKFRLWMRFGQYFVMPSHMGQADAPPPLRPSRH